MKKSDFLKHLIKKVEQGDLISDDVLIKICLENNINNVLLPAIFPHGASDLIEFYFDKKISEFDIGCIYGIESFTEKISILSQEFYQFTAENKIFIQAIAKFLLKNPKLGATIMYKMSDFIMKSALDSSLDFSFYTKRAILMGILSSVSIDIAKGIDSELILQKINTRINATRKIGKFKSKISNLFGKFS